jgi:hypothetical protein
MNNTIASLKLNVDTSKLARILREHEGKPAWTLISLGIAIVAAGCDIAAQLKGVPNTQTRLDIQEELGRLLMEAPTLFDVVGVEGALAQAKKDGLDS